jgi:hypothetical protein
MASTFTARNLRTLRRLARVSSLPVAVNSPKQITLRFILGGENRTPTARRRLRQSIRTSLIQHKAVTSHSIVVRYGASELQIKQIFHPELIKIQHATAGEVILVDLNLFLENERNTDTFISIITSLKSTFEPYKPSDISQGAKSVRSGPTLRAIYSTLPIVNPKTYNDSVSLFRPSKSFIFGSPIEKFESTVLIAIIQAVISPVSSVSIVSTKPAQTCITTLTAPVFSVINVIDWRINSLKHQS